MQKLRQLSDKIDHFTEVVGQTASWISLLLVLSICADVLMRYLFNITFIALFELEWHLFAILFLAGAGYTLKHDRHVRVDVFYTKFSPKAQAWINFLGTLFFLIPFCIMAIKGSIPYVATSWKLGEGSNDAGGLPARYIIKSAIILGFALLLLQGVSLLIKSLLALLHSPSEE